MGGSRGDPSVLVPISLTSMVQFSERLLILSSSSRVGYLQAWATSAGHQVAVALYGLSVASSCRRCAVSTPHHLFSRYLTGVFSALGAINTLIHALSGKFYSFVHELWP